MQITLVHKPDAGDGRHDRRTLVAAFEAHGHSVTYRSKQDDDLDEVLALPADCVVVAGGDGTVTTVAFQLVGRDVPFTILPLGTANNLAVRLGLLGSPDELAAGLASARRRPLDVGRADGPWGTRRFLEGVGFGAFPRTITAARREPESAVPENADRATSFRHDLRLLRERLDDAPLRRYTLALDDEPEQTGDYLLLEITNTGLVGPNVPLAPTADPGDGWLEVVTVDAGTRAVLAAYLEARRAGEDPPLALPVRRARRVRVSARGGRIHVGDAVWPEASAEAPDPEANAEVTIGLEPAGLTVLVPARPDGVEGDEEAGAA